MRGDATQAQIAGFLVALRAKGETADEIAGCAEAMREHVLQVNPKRDDLVDIVGTGGDGANTFNISTAAALIAAASGVKVVKHGNRSASSKAGSADVLEALGLNLDQSPQQLQKCLGEANICFAFARSHHPAMKFVAAARTSLGIPTIFNVLGPLTNPAGARYQLLGVFAPELTDRMAAVLRELGSQRAWVVHADDGLDELSTIGPTRVSELSEGRVRTWSLEPKSFGIEYARLSDLQVNTAGEAADALRRVFAGERGPMRDIVLLNAAAALLVAGIVEDIESGLKRAAETIDSGAAQTTLQTLVECSNCA